jgi:hypothetical protein
MNRSKPKARPLDILFPLLLFAVFAIIAVSVILFSARVYKHSVDLAERNYSINTARAYILQKIRKNDTLGAVSAGQFGGTDALILSDTEEDGLYETCIYLYEGSLRELYQKKGANTDPSAGTPVLALDDFSVKDETGGLLRISCTDPDGNTQSFLAAVRSGQPA